MCDDFITGICCVYFDVRASIWSCCCDLIGNLNNNFAIVVPRSDEYVGCVSIYTHTHTQPPSMWSTRFSYICAVLWCTYSLSATIDVYIRRGVLNRDVLLVIAGARTSFDTPAVHIHTTYSRVSTAVQICLDLHLGVPMLHVLFIRTRDSSLSIVCVGRLR